MEDIGDESLSFAIHLHQNPADTIVADAADLLQRNLFPACNQVKARSAGLFVVERDKGRVFHALILQVVDQVTSRFDDIASLKRDFDRKVVRIECVLREEHDFAFAKCHW